MFSRLSNPSLFRSISWLAPLVFCGLAFSQQRAMRVTEPAPAKDGTIVTSEPALSLKETLMGTGAAVRILWESNRGFHDLAAVHLAEDGQMIHWNTKTTVPLRPGVNHVRIKARDSPYSSAFVNILYIPAKPVSKPRIAATMFRGKQITYEVINGLAVYQGDMVIGTAPDVAAGRLSGRARHLSPRSATIAPDLMSPTGLWPLSTALPRCHTRFQVETNPIRAS